LLTVLPLREREIERGDGRQGAASVGADQVSGECGASQGGDDSESSAGTAASAQPHGVLQRFQQRAHAAHEEAAIYLLGILTSSSRWAFTAAVLSYRQGQSLCAWLTIGVYLQQHEHRGST